MIAGWIACVFQLFVPSYALRLVRRFGVQRVGWFVVIAFASLALMHLVLSPRFPGAPSGSSLLTNGIVAVACLLLVLGMGHLETLFAERQRTFESEEAERSQWQLRIQQETAALAQTKEQLLHELNRREQIEKALRESETRYRFLFTENPLPMWILDLRNARFLAANKAALEQYGFSAEEFASRTVHDILPEEMAAAFLRDIARPFASPVSRGLWQHCRKDRTLIDVEITAIDLNHGNAPARLVIANNIGQRRRDEARERQIQKMEVIGQVAGGVANHFDDLLKTIEGRTSLLIQNEKAADCIEHLNDVSAAVGRATALTHQLLLASGRQSIALEPLELNGLIQSLSQMLRRLLGGQILLQNTYSAQMPLVLGNRQLLEHIIVNLVLNARDAMQLGGSLSLHTSAARFAAGQLSQHPDAKAGEFIRLTVRDTGCGMPPEVQARLFEPFFTTKEPGKGTGLGLASVYGAVKQQSGWIEFTSTVGSGTEFRIFLPCAPATAAAVMPARSQTQDKKVILLVESEPRARGLAHCALNWHGYRVIEADCPSTALMFWQASKPKPDLLIADALLSDGTSGNDFAEQLRQSKVDLKVLFIGAAESNTPEVASRKSPKFISRPFNPKELVDAVQNCLDGEV